MEAGSLAVVAVGRPDPGTLGGLYPELALRL